MHYTKNGYDIEVDSDLFKEGFYRTSRYQEPPVNRPINIYNGDSFWGLMQLYYKVNKDAYHAYRSGLGYVQNTGVWISGWIIAKNNWQTSRAGVWVPADGTWRAKAFNTVPAQYSRGNMGDNVCFDARREIWIGEVFNPNDPNDVHWYTDFEPVNSGWCVIGDDDASVFRNILLRYSFDVSQPMPVKA